MYPGFSREQATALIRAIRKVTELGQFDRPDDIKRGDNSVAASYLFQDEGIDGDEFLHLLTHPRDMRKALRGTIKTVQKFKKEAEAMGLDPEFPAGLLACYVNVDLGDNAQGFDGDAEFIHGETEERSITLPSGRVLDYELIVKEESANHSALMCGYSLFPDRYFVRWISLEVTRALLKARKDEPELAPYRHVFEELLERVDLPTAAHEIIERADVDAALEAARREGREFVQDFEARETRTEGKVLQLYRDEGLDEDMFWLDLLLRASPEDMEPNMPRTVLERLRAAGLDPRA